MYRISVFSPNRYSLYTSTVTELFIRKGVEIQSIYVRKLINPARFRGEFRRDGSMLIKKIWKKLLLREAGYQKNNDIRSFREESEITISDVYDFSKERGTPVVRCNGLNDPIVVEGLKKQKPDLVVFTGGGLIRQDILENSGHGVINCHMGVLPYYRGMDVVEWPILDCAPDKVGITVHFMDKGVDTGDILKVIKIPPENGESIKSLRDRIEPIMCRAIVDITLDFLNGKIQRMPQLFNEGKQYFRMHPSLLEITKSYIT